MGKVFRVINPTPKVQPIMLNNSDDEKKKAEEKARQDALERQRRGMDSLIKTSYNGIVSDDNAKFQRKKLLGE